MSFDSNFSLDTRVSRQREALLEQYVPKYPVRVVDVIIDKEHPKYN